MARLAGSMRGFHFGPIRETRHGSTGSHVLHLQCPWRLDGPGGVITGSDDIGTPGGEAEPEGGWQNEFEGSLQQRRLRELLCTSDQQRGSIVSTADSSLVVAEALVDPRGEILVTMSKDVALRIFPASSSGESWRLIIAGEPRRHVVWTV